MFLRHLCHLLLISQALRLLSLPNLKQQATSLFFSRLRRTRTSSPSMHRFLSFTKPYTSLFLTRQSSAHMLLIPRDLPQLPARWVWDADSELRLSLLYPTKKYSETVSEISLLRFPQIRFPQYPHFFPQMSMKLSVK